MAIQRFVTAAAAMLAALVSLPASTQQMNAGECILAGRITPDEKWAPRFEGVQLLAPNGRVVTTAKKQQLGDVQQVRLSKPALLTRCDGDGELARSGDLPVIPKEAVPAVSAGVVDVASVGFPRLRSGGELVELKLRVPLDRVVMVRR